MSEPEVPQAQLPVLRALENLRVAHYVGGSLASSAHGVPRASIDADVVAALEPRHASGLIASLGEAYYLSEERLRDAIARRASCNLIHLGTMIKIALFVARDRSFDRRALERHGVVVLGVEDPVALPIATAEDILLAKLEWYRLGGEASARQWDDVLGILRVSGESLDREYLRAGATELGVEDLYEAAVAAVRETPR